jgi:hypothetical protein
VRGRWSRGNTPDRDNCACNTAISRYPNGLDSEKLSGPETPTLALIGDEITKMNANQPSNKVQHNCHRSPVPEARDPDKQLSTQQEMNRSPKIGSSTKRVSGQQTRATTSLGDDERQKKIDNDDMLESVSTATASTRRICLDQSGFSSGLRAPLFLFRSASFFMCDGIGSFIQKSPVTLPSQAPFAHLVRDHFPRSFSLCLPLLLRRREWFGQLDSPIALPNRN